MSAQGDRSFDRAAAEILRLIGAQDKAATQLDKHEIELLKLGINVFNYFGIPIATDIGPGTSFREDDFIDDVARLLANTDGPVKILDVCCGNAPVLNWLMKRGDTDVKRLCYCGLDKDSSRITALKHKYRAGAHPFGEVAFITRQLPDLNGAGSPPFHRIILANTLHELPPSQFAIILHGLNSFLVEGIGELKIIDMESHPPTEGPENCAIHWREGEVREILNAGGFKFAIAPHQKREVGVFNASVYPANTIDIDAINETIRRLIQAKLENELEWFVDCSITIASAMNANPPEFAALLFKAIVSMGTITRCAMELKALNS